MSKNLIYQSGTVVLIKALEFMSDVVLGKMSVNLYIGDKTTTVETHTNDIDDHLALKKVGIKIIKCEDILREVTIESLDFLTEIEYVKLTEMEDIQPIPTENELNEPESSEQDVPLSFN